MSDSRRYPLTPLPGLLARAMSEALNGVLALDPTAAARIRGLEGRSLQIDFRGTGLAFDAHIEDARVRLAPSVGERADLRMAASPGALLALLLRPEGGHLPAAGGVEIAGDAELGQALQRLALGLRPDWDELPARLFGDVIGHQVARIGRSLLAGLVGGARNLAETTAEYLVEESRDLVARVELEGFLDGVDQVREDVDRLEARIARLAERRPR